MAILRTQICGGTYLAFFIWLQKIGKCASTKYDIDLPEMNYLSSNLSPQQCYDFYRSLSHRIHHAEASIYAEKEKTGAFPCINLLATWLTDPEEALFRSHENIELTLRKIGRNDLAHWMLGKIDSSLKRRRELDVVETDNRQIQESEEDDVIVRERIGEKILPSVSLSENQVAVKNGVTAEDDRSCVFWKIFLSSIVCIFLVLLFVCSYKFLYTKLRCICRRFADSEDRECCLPEQTYGTTSGLTSRAKNPVIGCSYSKCPAHDYRGKAQNRSEVPVLEGNFSSATDANELENISSFVEERRALLSNLASQLTKHSSLRENNVSRSRCDVVSLMNLKFYAISESEKLSSSTSRNTKKIETSDFGRNRIESLSEKNLAYRKTARKFRNKFFRSLSDAQIQSAKLSSSVTHSAKKSVDVNEKHRSDRISDWRAFAESSKTVSRNSSNILSSQGRKTASSMRDVFTEVANEKNWSNCEIDKSNNVGQVESLTGLSETYDELGMLFSQQLKLQSRPCRRKYCPLARNLRAQTGRTIEHDERKCRSRSRANFSFKLTNVDQRPACSSGNICRETYDEFELMRASRKQRESLACSIVERRKRFLDQPCVSPAATQRFDEPTDFSYQT